VDALYIGGGFPETCAAELEANSTLRAQIRHAIENGMPAYAECGGLMYLSRGIEYQGRIYQMVGAIPGDVKMHDNPSDAAMSICRKMRHIRGRAPIAPAKQIKAHEFHTPAWKTCRRHPLRLLMSSAAMA